MKKALLTLLLAAGLAFPVGAQSNSKIVTAATAAGSTGAIQSGTDTTSVAITFCGTGYSGVLYVDAASTAAALAQVWTTTLTLNSDCATVYTEIPASKWHKVRWTLTAGSLDVWMQMTRQGTTASYGTMSPPSSATLGCVGVFLGSPLTLQCDAGIGYDAATDTLTMGNAKNAWGNGAFLSATDPFRIGNTSVYGIVGAGPAVGSVPDTGMSYGGAPGIVAFGNGNANDFSGGTKAAAHLTAGANGLVGERRAVTQLVTLDTGGTTTVTTAGFIPARSRVIAITYRVTAGITTAANYSIGVTGGNAYVSIGTATSAQTGVALGSTGVLVPNAIGDQYVTAASTITITTNANPGAGAIRLGVIYESYTPPAS